MRVRAVGGGGEMGSGGAEERRKKRELIIFGYLARKSHPKFSSPWGDKEELIFLAGSTEAKIFINL